MVGATLNHYEIGEKLGAGGMGTVYRARDQKLGRDVAIKVLPEEFARDPDRVARFQREAKLLASVNHPNIAAIYGLEESGGTNFIVLELIEGETLADRIETGPIPVEESLRLALQIAEAFEAAHEKGVIHRDLKPANIKVTPEGKVKVLDFGLAKAYAGDRKPVNLSNSPTLSDAATLQGVILGTAAYMSPEQARGKSVDKRTDIWAFGAVLFEILTGGPAFSGNDMSDILAAVIRAEPDWSKMPAGLHWRLREALARCLEKDPQNRYHDISDVRLDLQKALADRDGLSAEPTPKTENKVKLRTIASWIAASAALCFTIAGIAAFYLKPGSKSTMVSRLSIALPPEQVLPSLNTPILALSPDGTKLAYVSGQGNYRTIYLRRIDSFEAKPFPGTEGAENPFFSPDGQWLGFVSSGRLMKVQIQGGAPLPLAGISSLFYPQGIYWGENEKILIAPSFGMDGLVQVSEATGKSTAVTRRIDNPETHRFPQFLPKNQAVLFTAKTRTMEDDRIVIQSIKTGEQKTLLRGAADGRYVSTGHLIFARQGNLFAVPFDADRLEIHGAPICILEGVMQSLEGVAQLSISNSGSLAYVPGAFGGIKRDMLLLDRSGKEQAPRAPARPYYDLRFAPDGKRAAITIEGAKDDIWIYDIVNQRFDRLTYQGDKSCPIWTPDGKWITFRSTNEKRGQSNLFRMPADGSEEMERLPAPENSVIATAWSPDGKWLTGTVLDPVNGLDVWILPAGKDGKAYPLLNTRANEGFNSLSPDGKWIAYQSDQSGKEEVYIQPFPGSGGVRQISVDGGTDPRWAQSGELFYRNGDKVMVVEIETAPQFKKGIPKMLFETKFDPALYQPFDVAPDGRSFLVIRPGEGGQMATQINIVLNWTEELKQRVPKRK